MSKMTNLHKFYSEHNLYIDGSEFQVKVKEVIDDQGVIHIHKFASGREGNSCAWYFVPTHERERPEKLGVVFKETERTKSEYSKRNKLDTYNLKG